MSEDKPDRAASSGLRARLATMVREAGATWRGAVAAPKPPREARAGIAPRRNAAAGALDVDDMPPPEVDDRIDEAIAETAYATPADIAAQVERLRVLQRVRDSRRRKAEQALPGTAIAYGVREIRAAWPLQPATVARLAARPTPAWEADAVIAPGPLVFFDTETTGLAGGTGTLVFLLGVAWLDDTRLHLRQWLLTAPAGERDWLAAIREALPTDATLVSFNGKAFDLPLMAARYRLGRLPDPFAGRAHWDLMHPLKRAFEKRWPDCRLQTAERRLLDLHRVEDLPGAFAPQAFSAYLRHGDTAMLTEVVRHNAQDVVSLAHLLPTLDAVYAEPDRFDADIAAVATRLTRVERGAQARALLERHVHDLGVRRLLATHGARERRWADVRALLAPLAETAHPCPLALERLAKIAEHVDRDAAHALALTERLLALQPGNDKHRRRHARLSRQLVARVGNAREAPSPTSR